MIRARKRERLGSGPADALDYCREKGRFIQELLARKNGHGLRAWEA